MIGYPFTLYAIKVLDISRVVFHKDVDIKIPIRNYFESHGSSLCGQTFVAD